jgi:tetratricopeptide (TPR) repeat protein
VEERYLDPEIERLTELYQSDPTSRVFAPLADAYRKSKLYDEAIDILKKGLEIHPDYVSAHLVLARCYYDKDMLQLAKNSLEKVLELDQQNIVALRLLGDILYRLGDEDGALARYKQVVEIDPTNLQVQALVEKIIPSPAQEAPSAPIEPQPMPSQQSSEGTSASASSETPETGQIIQQGSFAAKEEAPVLEQNEFEEPEELQESARESNEMSFATVTLAEIYEKQGFLEKALEVYKQLLEAAPDDEELKVKVRDITAKLTPKFEEQIEKTEASFPGLLAQKEPEAQVQSEGEKEAKKGDFMAFKQWLEGLSKNEEAE